MQFTLFALVTVTSILLGCSALEVKSLVKDGPVLQRSDQVDSPKELEVQTVADSRSNGELQRRSEESSSPRLEGFKKNKIRPT